MAKTPVVVLFSAIPVVLALRQLALVNFVVIYAGKLLVSFLFVPVLIGLNWRRATGPGAIAAMLGGLSVCVGWSLLSPTYPLGIDPWEMAIATSLVLFFPAEDGEPAAGRSSRQVDGGGKSFDPRFPCRYSGCQVLRVAPPARL